MTSTKNAKPRRAGRGFVSANAFEVVGLIYSIATVITIVLMPFLPAILGLAVAIWQFLFGGLQ